MPKLQLKAGTTSKTVKIFVQDSSVTTGAGLTGLAYNTASLTAYYTREGTSGATAITLVTATQGTWTSSGFIVVDGTNMPGVYELGMPNAALAAGAASVVIMLKGATNMVPVVIEIELTAVDNQSATAFMTSVATVTNLTNAPTAGDLTATMKSSVSAAILATPANLLSTDASGRVILQYAVHKNTALTNFQFPMTLASDHVSPYTGAGATITGVETLDGTKRTLTNSGSASAITGLNGVYQINLSAADLNGNNVCLIFSAATCDDTKIFFTTQS